MSVQLHQILNRFNKPKSGSVLLSEPYLNDPNFRRSVVLISNHDENGSVGFILNKRVDLTTKDVIPDLMKHNFPLFYGGPVEPHTLHFIHKIGDLITGAQHIVDGIYWGGDIEMIDQLIDQKIVSKDAFRFFSGYSGWTAGQLDEELNENNWWVGKADVDIIFDYDLKNMWRNIVKKLGQDFSYMANAPEDRSWN